MISMDSMTELELRLLRTLTQLMSVNGGYGLARFRRGVEEDGTVEFIAQQTGFWLEDSRDRKELRDILKKKLEEAGVPEPEPMTSVKVYQDGVQGPVAVIDIDKEGHGRMRLGETVTELNFGDVASVFVGRDTEGYTSGPPVNELDK